MDDAMDLMDVDQSLDDLVAILRQSTRSTAKKASAARKTPHQTLPTSNASARTMTKASFAAAAAAKRRGAPDPSSARAAGHAATSLFTRDLRKGAGAGAVHQRESSISTLDLRIESGRLTTKELRQARQQEQAKTSRASLTKTLHTREAHFKHEEPPIAKLGAGDLRLTLGLSTKHLRRSPPVPTTGAAKSKASAIRAAAPMVVATEAAAAARPVSPPERRMDDVPIQVTFTRPGTRTVGPAPPSPIVVELDRPPSSSHRRVSRSPARRRRRSPDIDQSRRDRVQERLLARGFKVVSSGGRGGRGGNDDEPMRDVPILPARRGRRDRSRSPVTSSSDRSMSIASTTRSPSPPPPPASASARGARTQGEPEPGEILPHQMQYQPQFGHAQQHQQHMYGFGVPQPQYISMPSYAPAYIQGPPVAQFMPAHAPPAPPAPASSAAYRTDDLRNNPPVATYTCRLSNCHPKSSPSLLTNQFAAEFDGFLDVTARSQADSRLPLIIYVTFSKRQSVRQLVRTLHNQTVSSYTMRAEPVMTPPDIVQALQMKGINAVGGDVHAY